VPSARKSHLLENHAVAETTFVVLVMAWGLTFVLSKNALAVIGPFTYNTLRMTLAALTLAVLTGRGWRAVKRADAGAVLVAGVVLFAAYALQAYGMQFTTASKAGFLTGTCVAYVPVFSAWLLRRRPALGAILGVALAVGGLYLMSGLDSLSLASGDTWVALGGIGWALYIIALTHYSPRVHLLAFSALHVGVAAVLSGGLWLLVEPVAWPTAPAAWLAIGIIGFSVIGLGTGVQAWVTRLIAPTRVALIATLEPVFAAVGGVMVGEVLTGRIVLGGGLILAGMLIAELGPYVRLAWFRRASDSEAA
jgi:drug/metabolite transporter (DMT)-like permease